MKRVVIVVALLALAVPASADASRLPTPREKRAIARDWAPNVRPDCLTIYVSDVSSRWASLTSAPPRRGESVRRYMRRCPLAGNGLAMLNKRGGKWRYVVDVGTNPREKCPFPRVPTRIAADLKACFAPERECENPDAFGLIYAPTATSCAIALRVALAYEAETDGEPSEDVVQLHVRAPDGLTYAVTCIPEFGDEIDIGCDSRRHRVTLKY